jgi:Glucose / Sorbosone dehydrogenase
MRLALIALALLLTVVAPAAAAPSLVKVGDFAEPLYITSPPKDPRLFVVEKAGRVQILGVGTFLDLSAIVNGVDGERGLLSMAFPPDYAASGLFYVFFTEKGTGDLKVREYQRSGDPNRANPAMRREFLSIPHGPEYHNGGQLQFGPDGMLYVSTGDGHNSANAQQTGSLLGKILRLDPRTGGAATGNPHGPVWAYGLRNPWRFSFDRVTGDMSIGDVGNSEWEEINWAPAPGRGRGMNFGWPDCEGPDPGNTCGESPIAAHDHANDNWCAVVGGYVVRDPGLPTLNGRYLYGDNCRYQLWSTVPRTGADDKDTGLRVPNLSSFGEDACGRVYATSQGGAVFRLQDGAATPCSFTVPQGGTDTTAPHLNVAISGLRTALKHRRLRVTVRCDEPCGVAIGTRLRHVQRLKTRNRLLPGSQSTAVRVKLTRKTTRRLRAALRRRGAVRVTVSVRATDAAGNARRTTRRARLKR